jgi:hypothetical protein
MRLKLIYECDRRWQDLEGDSRVRQCDACDHPVVNLSALDEAAARALLEQNRGGLCVRYRVKRGNVVFAKVARGVALAAAAAVMLAAEPARAVDPPPSPPPMPKKQSKKKKKQPKRDDEERFIGLPPSF